MAPSSSAEPALKAAAEVNLKANAQLSRSHRRFPRVDLSIAFYGLALAWYLRVWLWHFSPQAAHLPGAKGFGWFTRYLTFYSFTLQLVQLILCCCSSISRDQKTHTPVSRWADDLSCALFGLANVVTIMFYFLEAATKDMVEGGQIERPPWLGFAVHMGNSVTAWLDLLLARHRSFSRRSSWLSLVLIAFYTMWILVSKHFNGAFPYPFLNKLPWPQGFIAVTLAGQILFFLLFKLGKQLRKLLQQAKIRFAAGL